MFNYNKIKNSNFEPGHTSQWVAYFSDKKGSELNLLGGLAPIQDFSFDFSISTIDVIVQPHKDPLILPKDADPPTKISLTFYDTHKLEIIEFMKNYINSITENDRAPALNSLNKKALQLVIEFYDKTGDKFKTYYLEIFPINNLTIRGDNSYDLMNLPIEFTIIGYKEV